jgi:hypothetical protein
MLFTKLTALILIALQGEPSPPPPGPGAPSPVGLVPLDDHIWVLIVLAVAIVVFASRRFAHKPA